LAPIIHYSNATATFRELRLDLVIVSLLLLLAGDINQNPRRTRQFGDVCCRSLQQFCFATVKVEFSTLVFPGISAVLGHTYFPCVLLPCCRVVRIYPRADADPQHFQYPRILDAS
jgi:hypothetical protein